MCADMASPKTPTHYSDIIWTCTYTHKLKMTMTNIGCHCDLTHCAGYNSHNRLKLWLQIMPMITCIKLYHRST